MVAKLYWITRILGYIASLAGIFLFLGHQADADPAFRNTGIGIVGAGFLAFFISYAIRAWLRFGARRHADKEQAP